MPGRERPPSTGQAAAWKLTLLFVDLMASTELAVLLDGPWPKPLTLRSYSFRAWVLATQEEFRTWRLSTVIEMIDSARESELGTECAK